jgi:PKD repeat protein
LTSSISGTNVVAVAGQDATFDVANFHADSSLDFASATIDWGDGSADTSGVINHDASTNALSTKGDITGEHTYSQPGTYTIVVTAQESGSAGSGNTATVTSTATVSGVINPGPVLSPMVVQGVAFDALTVATFTTQLPKASASDFTATIDWGDKSGTSQGTIVPAAVPLSPDGAVSNSSSSSSAVIVGPSPTPIPIPTAAFAVTGGHTYDTSGTFTATITISDSSGDSVTTTADFTVVSSSLTITAQGQDVSAVTGDGTTPLIVASFTVSPSTAASTALLTPDDFQATIDWGDGSTPTSGQIFFAVLDPPGGPLLPQGSTAVPVPMYGPRYFVEGEHDYTQAGTDTITITITGPGGASAMASSTATVTNPINQGKAQGVSFNATTNEPDTNQIVAFFPAAGPDDSPDNYTATIDWGDGSKPSTGTVSYAPFAIDGSGASGGSTTGSTTAVPQSANSAIALPIALDEFLVSGDHTYMAAGAYTVTVTITDQAGNTTATTTSTATVTDTSAIEANGVSFSATTNQADTGQTVADFHTSDPNASASDFTATIDWGDGTTSTGTITSEPEILPASGATGGSDPTSTGTTTQNGGTAIVPLPPIFKDQFAVSGDHTYKKAGSYTVTVTISDTSGANTATTTSTATVSDDTITAYPLPVAVQTDSPDVALAVADFDDSAGLYAGDFTVTIDWGDGSSPTAGTVKQGPFAIPLSGSTSTPTPTTTATATTATPSVIVVGQPGPIVPPYFNSPYVVFGQHNYAMPGQYTIAVTITSTLGAQASVSSPADVTATPPVPFPIPQPIPIVLPVTASTAPVNTGSSAPIVLVPPPVSTPSPVTVNPVTGDGGGPSSNGTTSQSDPPPASQVGNTSQPQPTVIVGASHPGKGPKKHHHTTPTVDQAKTGHVKANQSAMPALRGKHKPA